MDDDHNDEQGIRCHFCGRLLLNPEESSPPCQTEAQAERCELYCDDWYDAGDAVAFRQAAASGKQGATAPTPPPADPTSAGIGGPFGTTWHS